MGSKQKKVQTRQKESFERRLKDRLSFLSERGTEAPDIDKDAFVKKLRANIRSINDRLKAIAAHEKKTADLAKKKAEKAAAPQIVPEVSKEKGKEPKKETKKAPKEGKEKEPKKETKKAPGEDKAKKKEKKAE